MGLKSFPQSNRSGLVNYWNNFFINKNMYVSFLYLSFFLENFFLYVFTDLIFFFFFYSYLPIKNYKLYNFYSFQHFSILQNIVLGKVWMFYYFNWLIVVLNMFFPRANKVNKKEVKKIASNFFRYKIHFNNYKYTLI